MPKASYRKVQKLNMIAWEKTHANGLYTEYPNSDAIGFFKNIKQKKFYSILELGCGSGNMQVFFRKEGFKSYGLDFSNQAIKNAKKNLKKNKLKTNNLICQDMRTLKSFKNINCIFDYNAISCTDYESIKDTILKVRNTLKVNKNINKINSLQDYFKYTNSHSSKNQVPIFITNLYSKNTKIMGGRLINSNTYYLSAGKIKNYVMTLFNFQEAKKILKKFKIIHYEIHKTQIPNRKFSFEKFTFYCI